MHFWTPQWLFNWEDVEDQDSRLSCQPNLWLQQLPHLHRQDLEDRPSLIFILRRHHFPSSAWKTRPRLSSPTGPSIGMVFLTSMVLSEISSIHSIGRLQEWKAKHHLMTDTTSSMPTFTTTSVTHHRLWEVDMRESPHVSPVEMGQFFPQSRRSTGQEQITTAFSRQIRWQDSLKRVTTASPSPMYMRMEKLSHRSWVTRPFLMLDSSVTRQPTIGSHQTSKTTCVREPPWWRWLRDIPTSSVSGKPSNISGQSQMCVLHSCPWSFKCPFVCLLSCIIMVITERMQL